MHSPMMEIVVSYNELSEQQECARVPSANSPVVRNIVN